MISLHTAESVSAEIKTRVSRCTLAQGAETNLAATVFQGRRHVDETMIPCVTIVEADDTPSRVRVSDEYEIAQRYVVFAYVPCSANDPNIAAHAAIRDIKRALFLTDGRADVRLGGKVRMLDYLGKDIGPRADGAAFVVVAVEVVAHFVERISAP